MTPTQYQTIIARLDKLDEKLDAALLLQARHDEQIKTIQKAGGGMATVVLGLALGWLKQLAGI